MDMTASFLPKPVTGVNGNGMHTNMSLAKKGKNLFWDKKGQDNLSAGLGLHQPHPDERQRHLPDPQLERERVPPARPALRGAEPDQGLGRRPRLDGPHPLGNEKSARIEVRSIAPDANPYLALYTLIRTGLEGAMGDDRQDKRPRTRFLPDNIYDAIRNFKASKFSQDLLGDEVHEKFAALKQAQADRCPKALGSPSRRRRSSSTTRSRTSTSGRSSERSSKPVPLEGGGAEGGPREAPRGGPRAPATSDGRGEEIRVVAGPPARGAQSEGRNPRAYRQVQGRRVKLPEPRRPGKVRRDECQGARRILSVKSRRSGW
jgi:hypothetical protein